MTTPIEAGQVWQLRQTGHEFLVLQTAKTGTPTRVNGYIDASVGPLLGVCEYPTCGFLRDDACADHYKRDDYRVSTSTTIKHMRATTVNKLNAPAALIARTSAPVYYSSSQRMPVRTVAQWVPIKRLREMAGSSEIIPGFTTYYERRYAQQNALAEQANKTVLSRQHGDAYAAAHRAYARLIEEVFGVSSFTARSFVQLGQDPDRQCDSVNIRGSLLSRTALGGSAADSDYAGLAKITSLLLAYAKKNADPRLVAAYLDAEREAVEFARRDRSHNVDLFAAWKERADKFRHLPIPIKVHAA